MLPRYNILFFMSCRFGVIKALIHHPLRLTPGTAGHHAEMPRWFESAAVDLQCINKTQDKQDEAGDGRLSPRCRHPGELRMNCVFRSPPVPSSYDAGFIGCRCVEGSTMNWHCWRTRRNWRALLYTWSPVHTSNNVEAKLSKQQATL